MQCLKFQGTATISIETVTMWFSSLLLMQRLFQVMLRERESMIFVDSVKMNATRSPLTFTTDPESAGKSDFFFFFFFFAAEITRLSVCPFTS